MKVKVKETEYGSQQIVISDKGRGNWCEVECTATHWGQEFVGFDGENHLLILITGWQSGHYYTTVILTQVDSETKVINKLLKNTRKQNLETTINSLIKQIGVS